MMAVEHKPYRVGLRKVGQLASIIAANTAVTCYQVTPGRSYVPRKIMWDNRTGANGQLQIGTGLGGAFAQILPDIPLISATGDTQGELELPELDLSVDLTVEATIGAAAPTDIQVRVEVEEYGS